MTKKSWFKGSIHTHTSEVDGDSASQEVVRWYRRHGYDFVVLTDHNRLTRLEPLSGKRRFRRPLVIPGEEVSSEPRMHVSGIGISNPVEPAEDEGEVIATLQANVDAVLSSGGIACINHPNDDWAFDHEEIGQVSGASLLEIFNGVIWCNSFGGPGKLSGEEIWDKVLSAGKVIYGVAVDDAHVFKNFSFDLENPGRGWVMVRAGGLGQDAIVQALASGDFYSSTGVTLTDLAVAEDVISLEIEQEGKFLFKTTFVGHGGTTLAQIAGPQVSYRIRGNEGYIRARVISSFGGMAWTQPVFTTAYAKT